MRVHQPGALRFSYQLEEAARLSADQFLADYRAYVDLYLPGAFPTDTGAGTAGSFAAWVRELDKASDAAGWGGGVLGNTLSSLAVTLSAEVGNAWLAGGASSGDQALRRMSAAIQTALRRLVPFTWFQDLANYGKAVSDPLLAYRAVPPMSAFTLGRGGVIRPKPGGDVYWWDLNDPATFDALVFSDAAVLLRPGAPSRLGEAEALAPLLAARFPKLLRLGHGHADGGDILVTPTCVFIGLSARTDQAGASQLKSLLGSLGRESRVVNTPRSTLHLKSIARSWMKTHCSSRRSSRTPVCSAISGC